MRARVWLNFRPLRYVQTLQAMTAEYNRNRRHSMRLSLKHASVWRWQSQCIGASVRKTVDYYNIPNLRTATHKDIQICNPWRGGLDVCKDVKRHCNSEHLRVCTQRNPTVSYFAVMCARLHDENLIPICTQVRLYMMTVNYKKIHAQPTCQ